MIQTASPEIQAMNTYMVFSGSLGSEQGAFLVFAHTAREARKVGWPYASFTLTDEYIDLAARRLRNKPWLYNEGDQAKLSQGKPHVIEDPTSCSQCFYWGVSPIGDDKLCNDCREGKQRE